MALVAAAAAAALAPAFAASPPAAWDAACRECKFGSVYENPGGLQWYVTCPTPYPAAQAGFTVASCIERHDGIVKGAVAAVTVDLRSTTAAEVPLGLFDGLAAWLRPRAGLTVMAPAARTLPAAFFAASAAQGGGGARTGLGGVVNVDLSYNSFQELPAALLTPCPGVEQLSLDHNQLSGIPAGFLDGVPGLRYLWAMTNNMSTLEPHTFSRLSQLQQLYLHDNPLRTLPGREALAFNSSRALQILTLTQGLSAAPAYEDHVFARVRRGAPVSMSIFAGVYCMNPIDIFPPYAGPQTFADMQRSCNFNFGS